MALLLEFTKNLNAIVEDMVDKRLKLTSKEQFQSEQINELAAAMAQAQGEYRPLVFNKTNPYERWEYTDLDAILEAVRPALTKYQLYFTQLPCVDDTGATILFTRVIHSSGQWIGCKARVIPALNDQHSYDSVLTFQKRAAALSILGLAGKNDRTDDDAELDMRTIRHQEQKGTDINYVFQQDGSSYERISKEQLEELEYIISDSGFNDLVKQLLKSERIETLADLPKSRYYDSLKKTNEIIALRKGIKK